MILKLILLIIVITAVYFIFFKKRPIDKTVNTKQRTGKKTKEGDEMIACAKCGTYVTIDDAFIKNARYYCSTECMNG
jgi:uncharacterized protein